MTTTKTPYAALLALVPADAKPAARALIAELRKPAPKPARQPMEPAAIARGCLGLLKTVAGRAAGGDVEALTLLATIADTASTALDAAVLACHDGTATSAGYSYAEIAARLGKSRQAVHQQAAKAAARVAEVSA